MKLIDTHIHIWNFSRARYEWLENHTGVLKRDYLIEELEPARTAAKISGGVLVQAANTTEETGYMLEVAASTSWLQGVVGWLPLTDPALTQQLLQEKYLSNPYFKGVRHLIHDEPDARWLLQPAVLESLRILAANNITYDIVGVKTEHIETALEVAERVPELSMIFDHCNQPPIATQEQYGRWGTLMKAAATHPQFHVKISGLGITAQKGDKWSAGDIKPYIIYLLEHFGEDRACCGGDWPVCLLAGDYVTAWKNYKEVLTTILSEEGQKKVFYENAERFYKLV
jgi:L-fuconolactonase